MTGQGYTASAAPAICSERAAKARRPSPAFPAPFPAAGLDLTTGIALAQLRGENRMIRATTIALAGRCDHARTSAAQWWRPATAAGREEVSGADPGEEPREEVVAARHADEQRARSRTGRLQAPEPQGGRRIAQAFGASEQAPEGARLSVRDVHAELLHQPRRPGVERFANARARARQGRTSAGLRPRAPIPPPTIDGVIMPERKTVERAKEDIREGKGRATD
jgi:hypothetical protein